MTTSERVKIARRNQQVALRLIGASRVVDLQEARDRRRACDPGDEPDAA